MTDGAQEMKDRHRFIWTLGDYPSVAHIIEPAAAAVADATGVTTAMSVLDVGAGTGNFAVEAARRGARVVASDLTPELIEIGRARTAEEGLDVTWQEADAEDLPFEDDSFDIVGSIFGAIFAPRATVVAEEMMRVVKPGGVAAITAWAADGYVGRTFQVGGRFAPPPPEGVDTPASWGVEETARARFERVADRVEIARASIPWEFESMEEEERFTMEKAPPFVAAKMALPPDRFEGMLAALREVRDDFNVGRDGRVTIAADYLIVLAHKAP